MTIFIFLLLLLSPLGFAVSAAGSPSITHSTSVIPDFLFQIPIGTNLFIKGADITSGKAIALYINMVYPWLVAFAAVLAVLAFTYAGVLWLIAAGDSGKVTESKKVMGNALIGLLLALGSYMFLATFGKDYVNFKPITVKPVGEVVIDLSPSVTISTGGTLIRSACRGPKKEGDRCSTDKPCECEAGVCTVGGVCGGLGVKEPEKLAKEKGLCCYVLDDGSKHRHQRDVSNSKACLDMILAADHVSMAYDRFFCPNITGVTVPKCWKIDAGSTDPAYYQRSDTLCKTYIDFSKETDTSGGSSTGPTVAPARGGAPAAN